MGRLWGEIRKVAKAVSYDAVFNTGEVFVNIMPDPVSKFLAPAIPYAGFAIRSASILGGIGLLISTLSSYGRLGGEILNNFNRKEYWECSKLAGQLGLAIALLGFHIHSEYSDLYLFPNFPTKNLYQFMFTLVAAVFCGILIVNLIDIVKNYFSRAEERERASVFNTQGQLWLSNLATTETEEGFIINCPARPNYLIEPMLSVSITNTINSNLPTINRNIYLTQTAVESYQQSNNSFFRNINIQNETISLLVPRPLEHERYITNNVSISIELGLNNSGVLQRINRHIGQLFAANEPEILAGAAA